MTQPAVTPPPPRSPVNQAHRPVQDRDSSVKETLESILVAFILAFIFRAFVVEAFVIPTGSMAPTLLGAHMRFTCPDCGYQFDANYSPTSSGGDDLYIPSQSTDTYRIFCPNCGFKLPENDVAKPPVHYGDRILVLKYLYLLRDPQRWDVVVFKSPDVKGPDDFGYDPNTPTYQQNYIKRLIGRPNESVMILDGDIYIGQPGQQPEQFTVQPKPRYVQEALWRVIYDNDYHPQEMKRVDDSKWVQPWTVKEGTGWNLNAGAGGRIFEFNNATGSSSLFFDRNAVPIFDRHVNPYPYSFTDWLAYDAETDPPNPNLVLSYGQFNTVHDLKLSCVYTRTSGDGPLRLRIKYGDDTFIAELTRNDARLFHKTPTEERPVGTPLAMPRGQEPVRVELVHADYQVTLRINDQVAAVTTPQDYHPNIPALLESYHRAKLMPVPEVRIDAENQTALLDHIGLWRDVYYINRPARQDGRPFHGRPEDIMHLGDDEYFVMGDNSLISGDARYWNVPIHLPADRLDVGAGRVPGRFMLGRAFFVYWPAGYRPGVPVGIAPNFGDMRFIR